MKYGSLVVCEILFFKDIFSYYSSLYVIIIFFLLLDRLTLTDRVISVNINTYYKSKLENLRERKKHQKFPVFKPKNKLNNKSIAKYTIIKLAVQITNRVVAKMG